MLAGRELAKSGLYLETYLFSPPFNSVPIENLIKNQTLKRVVRIWASIIKAGIAIIVKRPSEDLEEDAFIMLSEWKPNMFVNPKDPICSEYIGQKSSLTGMTADVYCHLTYSNEKMGFFEISLVPGAMSDEKVRWRYTLAVVPIIGDF
ncbi:hypothetical protein E3N88_23480 [Mikania micrantha]|uniref:Uncharacterized protein n=1 Tax=Mikania micrantha TaxID=192012 RepID=A0A5N6NEI9_9ASTR|nr:hypothetical protein E3N88_23480 [Mikania micrantha]